ncbi:MAG: helix-turn-helix transcriptional regulator [Alicyclobacillus herbarius]|uniref:helix-turn-helix domain-containing protein n=1 Tax=Alicyclobacillus herbarius TaxID=122960 RepID=UPI002354B675|nr:helix-turn-helix transcriptional regulator [Alicyclobacillus herbarius]MCL6633879.1 helix-turn-helix transcriptional regulator [Alicyclobacillus herbarius]
MSRRHGAPLVPRVRKHTADTILRTLKSGEPQCRAAFAARLAKLGLPGPTQESLRSLFGFLLGRIDTALADEGDFCERFQEEIFAYQPHVSLADVILLLQHWEELILSVLWQDCDVTDAEAVFLWVHSVTGALSKSIIEDLPRMQNASTDAPAGGRYETYDVVLDFDDALFGAKDLADVFEITVTYVCRVADFARGALFLYNPLTYSAEGVYGHNLDVDEIMRIHESERSLPVLQWAMHVSYPAFYEDVTPALPEHYVRRFQLKSLFVCPIPGPSEHPMGALLLDQAGHPFSVDEETMNLVSRLLSRVGKVLQRSMYDSLPAQAVGNQRGITQRERKVLQCIADGHDTKETGKRLHISEHTVTEYVGSILRKLQAKNRTEAVAKGIREGIIQ